MWWKHGECSASFVFSLMLMGKERVHISVQDPMKISYILNSVCVIRMSAHLKAAPPLLAADAGQHEEHEGEEARERDSDHGQGWRPGQLIQRSAICRTHRQLQTAWIWLMQTEDLSFCTIKEDYPQLCASKMTLFVFHLLCAIMFSSK